jgi:serine/threonine protein kinase
VERCDHVWITIYTACGKYLRFDLLQPQADNTLAVSAVDTQPFDCANLQHRVQIFKRSLNLVFIFNLLASYAYRPRAHIDLVAAGNKDREILTIPRTPPQNNIQIYLDRVVKVCIPAPDAVYDAVASIQGSISIERTKKPGEELTTIITKPVHSQVLPLTFKQLVRVLRSVLLFLHKFHEKRLLHRDIRWPNILRTGQGKWILIDFELAAEFTAPPLDDVALDPAHKPPEARGMDRTYDVSGEVWQVGMLIHKWLAERAVAVPKAFTILYTSMIDGKPINRPCVSDAYRFLEDFLSFSSPILCGPGLLA